MLSFTSKIPVGVYLKQLYFQIPILFTVEMEGERL